jgi:hypothetical protein
MTVGAAALDAAEQAKRAAELAERASAAVAARPVLPHDPSPADQPSPLDATVAVRPDDMDDFTARADQLAERLSRLQRMPLTA